MKLKLRKGNLIFSNNTGNLGNGRGMRAVEKAPEISRESGLILEAISNPERYEIMVALGRQREGLSFSQLAQIFSKNHNTLDRHLKLLTRSTLVWNFYERRETRDHSFYKLATLGERLLNDLKQEIILTT